MAKALVRHFLEHSYYKEITGSCKQDTLRVRFLSDSPIVGGMLDLPWNSCNYIKYN